MRCYRNLQKKIQTNLQTKQVITKSINQKTFMIEMSGYRFVLISINEMQR